MLIFAGILVALFMSIFVGSLLYALFHLMEGNELTVTEINRIPIVILGNSLLNWGCYIFVIIYFIQRMGG